MPHTGKQINVKQALALGHHAGWRGRDLTIAVSVMSNESARYIGAYYMNPDTDDADDLPQSVDRGLMQINTGSGLPDDQDAFCPVPNVEHGFKLWQARGFSPWAAYNSGKYLRSVLYTAFIRITKRSEWMAIDVTNERLFPCAPVPQEVLDWREAAHE